MKCFFNSVEYIFKFSVVGIFSSGTRCDFLIISFSTYVHMLMRPIVDDTTEWLWMASSNLKYVWTKYRECLNQHSSWSQLTDRIVYSHGIFLLLSDRCIFIDSYRMFQMSTHFTQTYYYCGWKCQFIKLHCC